MSLPWFAFNIKDFVANTLRLSTEAKGAYLMLLLDYYEHEKPPPDDDEVLATITGLPIETWLRHRKVIEPLFSVTDGKWHHDRVCNTLCNSHSRHTATVERTAAARAAATAKRTAKSLSQGLSRTQPQTNASVTESVTDPVTEPVTGSVGGSVTALTNTNTDIRKEVSVEASFAAVQRSDAPPDTGSLGSQLPADWEPDDDAVAIAEDIGMALSTQQTELARFHAAQVRQGTFSTDWKQNWLNWCRRWSEKHPPAAREPRPRVEVNASPSRPKRTRKPNGQPLPADWAPNAEHAELAIKEHRDLDREAAKFRNYCENNPTKYSKHDEAFSNWLMSDFGKGRSNGNAQNPRRGGLVDASDRIGTQLEREITALRAAEEDQRLGTTAVLGLPEH